jgi:aryl-alcohol dehydrogenase-like predicted oxidoreductase
VLLLLLPAPPAGSPTAAADTTSTASRRTGSLFPATARSNHLLMDYPSVVTTSWPGPPKLRIGLGCMRLSTEPEHDEELALQTIAAALEAGVTVFDTARSYGLGENDLGHNERLLARALRRFGADDRARIVTKGGMTRVGGGWIPDGRAKALRADCEASLAALDGLPIDLYLIHAPDPRTPWRTSLRALERLVADGLVRHVGVSNVNRRLLDEALELAPIAAVQVGLSPFDVGALRGGVVARCAEAGVAVIAHSPLGGPRRAPRLARNQALADVAKAHSATPAEVALAWLLALSPEIVAIPGARRPETARSAAAAAAITLDPEERALLDREFGTGSAERAQRTGAEVVLVMGIPGAGKSRVAEEYVARGYERLNRDERGGSLRELASALDEMLAAGVGRVVLDNTYLTRASRSYVIEAAGRHGASTRCVWLDTPLAQAQVNHVEWLLECFESLASPKERRGLAPTSQMRALRELEPPSLDEGLTEVEHVLFARESPSKRTRPGVFVAAAVLREGSWEARDDPDAPHLVFDWRPDGAPAELAPLVATLAAQVSGPVESALCPHPAGPPICWCRPPLPGLPLAFARAHGVDPARSILVGASPAHRTLATTLGARYVDCLRIS